MRVLAFVLLLLLAPLAAAGAEGDCTPTQAGLVCVGDYAWTEGDEGCAGDAEHEEGTGLWTETIAGDASASGFTYCNVYYDSSYHETGVRARVDTEPAFLEVSWNAWRYDDPTQHLEGCSTWVYYVGPAYGYYNNAGCPAGGPPSDAWGDLWPPAGAAPAPLGCTMLPGAYACALEEREGCTGFTMVGAGANGLAGGAVGGTDACGHETFVATASVSVLFVNAGWSEGPASCHAWAYANSLPFLTVPCDGLDMPDPGWGDVLP